MNADESVNILMVDDQPGKLLTYETILSELGERLIKATSGREALEHLLRTDIAVVLLDVVMPDADGFELAFMIRQHPRFKRTAVILISAIHMSDLDRLKGYEAGAVDYIPVPVIPEILRAKVRVFAELYRKTQQLERLNLELEQRVNERTAALEASTERLREADRRKDHFLATLAHELRNPLAPIASAAMVLKQRSHEDPKLEWAQEVIHRQVTHLTRLVDDLLDISRISRNKIELRKERVELANVIEAALECTRPHMEEADHELTVTLPQESIVLDADGVRLSQVFANLLNNSAKFTPRGGHVSVTAERLDDTVEIRIQDDGIGIPAGQLARIPELFYQLDTSLDKTRGGLGIGLAIVYELVQMHEGTVEAHSAGTGRGCEFVVRLPLRIEEARERIAPDNPAASVQRPADVRVLVVDDNRDSADGLTLYLQLAGYNVATAYNGTDALELAESFKADALLIDIGMPDLNGYEVVKRLRAQPWGKRLLTIAQTGWGQEEDISRAEAAGFKAHLTKPIDFDELERLLQFAEPAWDKG